MQWKNRPVIIICNLDREPDW